MSLWPCPFWQVHVRTIKYAQFLLSGGMRIQHNFLIRPCEFSCLHIFCRRCRSDFCLYKSTSTQHQLEGSLGIHIYTAIHLSKSNAHVFQLKRSMLVAQLPDFCLYKTSVVPCVPSGNLIIFLLLLGMRKNVVMKHHFIFTVFFIHLFSQAFPLADRRAIRVKAQHRSRINMYFQRD